MKKRALALFLAMTMIFGIVGCDKTDSKEQNIQESTENVSGTKTFTDDCGREVEVPSNITSIVASGPISQIILYPLAGDEFVGLSYEWGNWAKEYIDEAQYDLPYFGQLYGSANLNIEELAAVGPQLIIDAGSSKDSIVEDMDGLTEQTMIPAVHIDADLGSMADAYRKLGKLLGKEEKAEELAKFCEETYDRTVSIMEQVGDDKVDALYITGETGDSVLAKGSSHGELIDMLTNNIAVVENPSPRGSGDQVSMEQIANWNPDFIIFSPMSYYAQAAEDETWSQLTAISSGNYMEVPEGPHNWVGSPPSVQRFLGMILLPAVLYAEYCDYDVKTEIQEYYKLFYDYEMTDEKYEELTANAFIK